VSTASYGANGVDANVMKNGVDASVTENSVDASMMENGVNASKAKTPHGHQLHRNTSESTPTNAPKWTSSGLDLVIPNRGPKFHPPGPARQRAARQSEELACDSIRMARSVH
jgi:hypothetical protein